MSFFFYLKIDHVEQNVLDVGTQGAACLQESIYRSLFVGVAAYLRQQSKATSVQRPAFGDPPKVSSPPAAAGKNHHIAQSRGSGERLHAASQEHGKMARSTLVPAGVAAVRIVQASWCVLAAPSLFILRGGHGEEEEEEEAGSTGRRAQKTKSLLEQDEKYKRCEDVPDEFAEGGRGIYGGRARGKISKTRRNAERFLEK